MISKSPQSLPLEGKVAEGRMRCSPHQTHYLLYYRIFRKALQGEQNLFQLAFNALCDIISPVISYPEERIAPILFPKYMRAEWG